MLLKKELTVCGGCELDVLIGVGPRAYRAVHLFAAKYELDRPLGDFGGHGGEDGLGPDVSFGTESTTCVGALNVYVSWRDRKCSSESCLNTGDSLGCVIDAEFVSFPGCDGGVWLHRIVVLDWCGVNLVNDHF